MKLPDGVTARLIVGLEIHVQLHTRSKMFCSCAVEFGAEPNSRTCPVCLGHPGVLPVINREALMFAARTALALNCTIAPFTKWDRKSYWYPDLPKNYQISQYDLPLGSAGWIEIPIEPDSACGAAKHKRIRINRAHLEEDAGKNIHDLPEHTLVDLNRTGTPLLEIVTEPDLSSAREAGALARELQRIVRYLGVSEADMQKGHMRFEPNINCEITLASGEITAGSREIGSTARTPIIEVKNLNSFRSLEGAIEYEYERQIRRYLKDPGYTLEKLGKRNRGWDDVELRTVPQRHKEEAHEYRYFPDPDLVPVRLTEETVGELAAAVPELPLGRRERLARELGIGTDDALIIIEDRGTGDLFEAALRHTSCGQTLAKHFLGFWLKHANDAGTTVAGLGLAPENLGELATLVADGTINATAAQRVAAEMLTSREAPRAIADRLDLRQVSDRAAVLALVEETIAANPKAVADFRSGGKKHHKALGFLQGQVMRLSRGSANPHLVGELLREILADGEEEKS